VTLRVPPVFSVTNKVTGITAEARSCDRGYAVVLRDDDSMMYLPEIYITTDLETAKKKCNEVLL